MSQNYEPFEYDSEQEAPRPKKKDPNRKMKSLYGDFWRDQSDSGSEAQLDADDLLLPSVSAKLTESTKFVKAEVLHHEPSYVASVKLAPAAKTTVVSDSKKQSSSTST